VPLTCEDVSCDGQIQTRSRSTFQVKQSTRFYPRPGRHHRLRRGGSGRWCAADRDRAGRRAGPGAVRRAGPVAQADGSSRPRQGGTGCGGVVGVGRDCLADVAVLRAEPGLFGLVASDPTISRTIDALAADAPAALAAIDTARAAARARVWALAGRHAPDHDTRGTLLAAWSLEPSWALIKHEHLAPTGCRGLHMPCER